MANALKISKVLYESWDPIGINELSGFDDEYDSYIGEIALLLERVATVDEISSLLKRIALERMGLSSPELDKRSLSVAAVLHSL
jgi:hypothetical protein